LRPARHGGEKPLILQCPDEAAEAKMVVADIASRLRDGVSEPRDFAILFRTNEQPRPFEMELRKAKLPYVLVGGMSFYDRAEVRDILAYLKLLVVPSDEVSLRRIINTPARGIGRKAVEVLIAEAVATGKPLWDVLPRAASLTGMPPAAIEAVAKFRNLIEKTSQRAKSEPLVEVVSGLISHIGYQDEIARIHKDPQDQLTRWATVESVVNTLGTYQQREQGGTLSGFLDEITLGDRDNEQDKETQLARNAIALMTLHSAKGLEFPQVYLVGMEEGLLPHRRAVEMEATAIDEERRLCYVGITRAQDRLTISLALGRMKWGKSRPTVPSRFLFEITGQADKAGDQPRPGAPARPPAKARTAGGPHSSAKPPQRRPAGGPAQQPRRPPHA
jgi:DNA helicase-2/ATP-dependent DNA helicase PcrA